MAHEFIPRVDQLVAEGKIEQAIGIILDFFNSPHGKGNPEVMVRLAELYLKKQDNPQSIKYYFLAAKYFEKHSCILSAIPCLQKVIELDPCFEDAYEMLILYLCKIGRNDEAKPYAEKLAKMREDSEELAKAAMSALDHLTVNVIESQIDSLISKAQTGDIQARTLLKKIQQKVGKALQPVKMTAKNPPKK